MDELRETVESIFRRESGRIIAGLIRASHSFDLAEEALQEALTAALIHWMAKGIPDNPSAWITTAAQRKLIDYARREQTRRKKEDQLQYETAIAAPDPEPNTDMPLPEDHRLSLIFTCCHPALNKEAQIALTLRTLGGLTTPEIACAFLIPESTVAQRLVRAKRKIQQARIPYQVPPANALPERLSVVQTVLYLIFNQGYVASFGDSLIRRDMCSQAIRLARTLCELMPDRPENLGLLALMLLHDSRRDTRVSIAGELVSLEEQDRTLWDHAEITEGLTLLERALLLRHPGPYQIQAAIAALHAQAPRPEATDWHQIAALYQKLWLLQPSETIALNHAVAVAMSQGPRHGLMLIDNFGSSGTLDKYHLYHAARADLLRRLGLPTQAFEAYTRALSLTTNAVEQRYLHRRIHQLH